LKQATAGQAAKFALAAWDGHGNISNPELDIFHVSICGLESPITLTATGRQIGDGRFTFTYLANVAGKYEVHVRLKCGTGQEPKPIKGSPFMVTVSPSATCASTSAVRRETEAVMMAGDTIRLWVQARDRYFNPRPCGGDRFELQLRSVDGGGGPIKGKPISTVGTVDDGGDGTYSASVSTTIAGTYRLLLVLMPPEREERRVDESSTPEPRGSSLAERRGFKAQPVASDTRGPIKHNEHVSQLDATGAAGAEDTEDGEEGWPPHGQSERGKEQKIRLSVTRRDSDIGFGPTPRLSMFSLALLERNTTKWRAKAEQIRLGSEEQLALEARRKGLRVFYTSVIFRPAPTHAPSCLVSGDGLWQSVVLQRNTFLIQPRDEFGNVTDEEAKSFHVSMSRSLENETGIEKRLGARDIGVACDTATDKEATVSISVSAGPQGSALASYICTQPGTYWLCVTLGRVPVLGSPFRCHIAAQEELPALAANRAQAARQFRANALSWDADTASVWEAHRSPREEYIRRKLTQPGVPVTLGVDTALTWRLAGVDPYAYEEKQHYECEGGASGSRGRYIARKRTAMLHYRLTSMSESLAPLRSGFSDCAPQPALVGTSRRRDAARPSMNPPTAPDAIRKCADSLAGIDVVAHTRNYAEQTTSLGPGLGGACSSARAGGAHRRSSVATNTLTAQQAMMETSRIVCTNQRPSLSQVPNDSIVLHEGHVRREKTGASDEPMPAKWRVLGPTPEPPHQPLPGSLTPRAQGLATALDRLGLGL